MQVGKFELLDSLPELRDPHVIASLTPWIDAGSVGSLSIERLERFMDAEDLGKLSIPGTYFDFTRYRPIVYYEDGERHMKIPNADIRFARGDFDHDFIFLHMLEPHSFSEEYIDALVEVLTFLNIKRFCRIGAMYDAVPHTRPLLVMGTRNGQPLEGVEGVTGNRRRPYQGPTSIMNMVGDRLTDQGIEAMMLMADGRPAEVGTLVLKKIVEGAGEGETRHAVAHQGSAKLEGLAPGEWRASATVFDLSNLGPGASNDTNEMEQIIEVVAGEVTEVLFQF